MARYLLVICLLTPFHPTLGLHILKLLEEAPVLEERCRRYLNTCSVVRQPLVSSSQLVP